MGSFTPRLAAVGANPLTAKVRDLENALRRELHRGLSTIYSDKPRGLGAGAPITRGYRLLARDLRAHSPDEAVNANSLRVYLTAEDRAIPESVLYGTTRRVDPGLLPRYDEIVALRDASRRHRLPPDPAALDAEIAIINELAARDDWLGVRDHASAVAGVIAQLPPAQRDEPLMAWRWLKVMHLAAHSAMPTGEVLRGRRAVAVHRSLRVAELAAQYAARWPRVELPQSFAQLEWDGRSTAFLTKCDAPHSSMPRDEHAWLMTEADRYGPAATAIQSELVLRDGQMHVRRSQLSAGIECLETAYDMAEQSGRAYSFTVAAKDLAVALCRRGERRRARRAMATAWAAAKPIMTPLLEVRLGVADLELDFDSSVYEHLRQRAERSHYTHQAEKADDIAARHLT